jgi:signal transduction protein with GAF and PtsI domain
VRGRGMNGLIIERAGPEDEVIKCMMPLTTSYDELDEALEILDQAMAQEFGTIGIREPAMVRLQADRLTREVA